MYKLITTTGYLAEAIEQHEKEVKANLKNPRGAHVVGFSLIEEDDGQVTLITAIDSQTIIVAGY